MTGQEFADLLYANHISLYKFSKETRLAYTTVRGWKIGKRKISPAQVNFINLYLEKKSNPQSNEQPKQS